MSQLPPESMSMFSMRFSHCCFLFLFQAKTILVDGSNGVASVAFDGENEFLWTGGHSV